MEKFLIIIILSFSVALFFCSNSKDKIVETHLQKCYDAFKEETGDNKMDQHCRNLFLRGNINWEEIPVDSLKTLF